MDISINGFREGPGGMRQKVARLDNETISQLRTFFEGWYERPTSEKIRLGQYRIDGVPMDHATPEREQLRHRLDSRTYTLCASLFQPDPSHNACRVQAFSMPEGFRATLVSSACPLIGVYYRAFDVGLARRLAGSENLEVLQILVARIPEAEHTQPPLPRWECCLKLFTSEEVELRWLVCRLNEAHQHLGLPH